MVSDISRVNVTNLAARLDLNARMYQATQHTTYLSAHFSFANGCNKFFLLHVISNLMNMFHVAVSRGPQ